MKKFVLLVLILSLGIVVSGCGEQIRERIKNLSNRVSEEVKPQGQEAGEAPEEPAEALGETKTPSPDLDQLLKEVEQADSEVDEAIQDFDLIDESEDNPLAL